MRRWYELRTQISVLQGVSVTQSGVVLSTVFIATLIFTPIFGKEFVNNLLSGNISNQRFIKFFKILMVKLRIIS